MTPRLLRTYAGSSFFDRWFIYNDTDPTNGMVNYVGRDYAKKTGLIYTTGSGSAVLSIDRTSTLPLGVYRNSVRMMSTDTYDAGNLIIIDMKHVPYGCSTWPAFWTFKCVPRSVWSGRPSCCLCGELTRLIWHSWPWPSYGEIDVYEGVNSRAFNQMTLRESRQASSASLLPLTDLAFAHLLPPHRYRERLHTERRSNREYPMG